MYKMMYLFLMLFMYSILGWVVEVIYTYFTEKKLINRGFLIGPYCPIYGVGVLLIVNFLKNYTDSPLVLFILAAVICMVLEYLTSYVMEKLFNARWWDYSNMKYNINGRICLETTIPFGLGGLIIMYIVNPAFEKILNNLSTKAIIIIGIICLIIFVTDMIISLTVILKFRNIDVSKYKDDTEEMNKKVRDYLMQNSPLTRRLIESFPNAKIGINKFKKKIKKSKEKFVSSVKKKNNKK